MSPKGLAPVVTVDGPSASGKGTIGQLLAKRLGWHFLDSGALYRIVGNIAGERGIPLDSGPALARMAAVLNIQFLPRDGALPEMVVDGREMGAAVRTEASGKAASKVAILPEVRQALLQVQRDFRRFPGLVADGRDMGTVVFPDAELKIFLTASPEVRAERRYKQLIEKGFDVNLARLVDEMRERDARDATREASPLRPAEDAYKLDTSKLTIPQVVDCIYHLLEEKRG